MCCFITAVITEQTGGQFDYQDINLYYFPRLGIELHQVTLAIPKQVQAAVASLRVSPEFIPLLTGKLHLARIELESPQLKLDLPVTKPKAAPAQPFSFTALEKKLAMALAPFTQVIPGLELRVNNAQLAIAQSKHKLFEIEGLNLQLGMSMTDAHSARGNLQATLSQLSIHHDDRRETIKDILLSGSLQMMDNKITASLDQLALARDKLVPFSERDILLLASLHAANNNPYGAAEVLEKLKGTPGISGTHIMAVHWESIIPRLVEEAGLLPTQTPAQV